MRLGLDSATLRDVRSLVEPGARFVSPLPSADTLQAAWADPSIRRLFAIENKEGLGRLLQECGIQAMLTVQGLVALNTGVPSDVIGAFAKTVQAASFDHDSAQWASIALGATKSLVDAGLKAMNAVPIVGWLAQLSYALVELVLQLAIKHKERPPLISYSRDTDEDVANAALHLVRTVGADWTPIFMPSADGPWQSKEASNGWTFAPKNGTDGFGVLPSLSTGFRVIQVRANPKDFAIQLCAGGKAKDCLVERTSDTFEQLPSLHRVAAAAWAAISSSKTAAIFNVRPWVWAPAWVNYFADGIEYVNNLDYSDTNTRGPAAQALKLRLAGYGRVSSAQRGPPVAGGKFGALAYGAASRIAQRQLALAKTKLCAYASEKQPAFASGNLRAAMLDARKQLLTTTDAAAVDPADVIDVDFRNALADYKGPRAGRMPSEVPNMPDLPPTGIAPSGSSGLIGLALIVGAVAAAVKLRK